MMPTELATKLATKLAAQRRSMLCPSRIARACDGRVLRRGQPASRVVIDSRELHEGDCFVALAGDRFDGHDFLGEAFAQGAAGAVVSRSPPDLKPPAGAFLVRVKDTFDALGRMAAEYRRLHAAKVVGITGSCGKTSTKDMLGQVLSAHMQTIQSPRSFNNHVGVPLTLFQLSQDTNAAVVEIGSSAPGEIEKLARIAKPDIAIVTRVDESHLAGLGSLEGVLHEKSRLLASLAEDGLAIINGDDPSAERLAQTTKAKVMCVRVEGEADWFATDIRFHGLGTSFRLQGETAVTMPRMGSHNVYNALFTVAAARQLGVPMPKILEVLGQIKPGSRRLQCKRIGKIQIIDDTYNSNPASARAALMALAGLHGKGRRIVVLGEMLELGQRSRELHQDLGAAVARSKMDVLITVGRGARAIAGGALEAGMKKKAVSMADDVKEAIDHVRKATADGDWLLFKASRGVGLDRLVDELALSLGEMPGSDAGA